MGGGRGRQSPSTPHPKSDRDQKFKGQNSEFPSISFGASGKEKKPIEFLQSMGEHVGINYEPSICFAFWSTPPEYGDEDEEPEMSDDIPAGNLGKEILRKQYCDPHSCTAVRVPAYVRFGSRTIRAIRFMTCLSLCLSVS